jgi:hypothetical protein
MLRSCAPDRTCGEAVRRLRVGQARCEGMACGSGSIVDLGDQDGAVTAHGHADALARSDLWMMARAIGDDCSRWGRSLDLRNFWRAGGEMSARAIAPLPPRWQRVGAGRSMRLSYLDPSR